MLIIFDCDGVLVDSEVLGANVFSQLLCDDGIDMSPQACLRAFKGRTLPECYRWLRQDCGYTLALDFDQRLRQMTALAFTRHLQAVAGVKPLLLWLQKQRIPFCVATNGDHAKLHASLTTTGLIAYFPQACRFALDDVDRGKPAPDLFLLAAESMGVPARFCWVLEDSVSGLTAAHAAGMKALMLDTSDEWTINAHLSDLVEARHVFANHRDVREFLAQKLRLF